MSTAFRQPTFYFHPSLIVFATRESIFMSPAKPQFIVLLMPGERSGEFPVFIRR